jgi:hypothetical protein
MKRHRPELVSALLDGQLTGLRRWLVQRHVNRCVVCGSEYRHQHHVRKMLAENLSSAQMNDSAEFFWSQVKRKIEAAGQQTAEVPAPRLGLMDWVGQHQYALASVGVAAVVIAAAFWFTHTRRSVSVAMVEDVFTELPDTAATAYPTSDKGTSVIWVSGLPWSSDMSAMKETFDDQGI